MTRLFGTDGVRGLANDLLTPDLALHLGQAAARVLATTDSTHARHSGHLRPRAVPPQRLLLKATSYITALSCRDRSIRLSSCKAIFCKKSRKIGTGFST